MNDAEYQAWWQLHLRVAQGESLLPQEQQSYEAGIEQFDQEEAAQLNQGSLAVLRRLRAQVQTLNELHIKLLAQSAQLNEQIGRLEQVYQQITGYELALDSHAAP